MAYTFFLYVAHGLKIAARSCLPTTCSNIQNKQTKLGFDWLFTE